MLRNRRLSVLLAICVTIFGLSRIAAQDATPIIPPTETSVPTLPPTEIPTDVPSATPLPTFTLTLTPTPLPTETPTLLPTPTASDTATETPTETPTLETTVSPTETVTDEPYLSPTSSPTATLTASPSVTASLMPTSINVQSFPTMPPPPNYGQLSVSPLSAPGNDVIEYRGIDTLTKFTAAINTANIDCAHTHVLYVSPGPYPLTPVNSTSLGLEITSKVVIVGNNMDPSKQVNDPIVAAIDKVIFTPAVAGKSVFSLPGNPGTCGSLTLYNVVISGAALTAPNAGGAVNAYDNLSIYNSLLKDNKVIGWGGAIYQGSDNLKIINSVFDNNQSNGNYTNTGGGAVVTQYAATFDSRCTTYKNNYSRNVGGAFYFFADSGVITFKHLLTSGSVDTTLSNNFESNTAMNGWGGFYSLPAVDATNQYWNPAPSTVAGNANSVFGTSFNPIWGSSVQLNPPNTNCTIPRVPLSLTTITQLLQGYGVTLMGDWTGLEQDVLDAVVITGEALAAQSTGNDLSQDVFKRVMGATLIIDRSNLNSTKPICVTTSEISKIQCDPTNQTTIFTLVHELGHMFNYRSGGSSNANPNKPSLYIQLQSAGSVKDLNPVVGYRQVIFGTFAQRLDQGGQFEPWWRGVDGWGSAARQPWNCDGANSSPPFNFQQNPCDNKLTQTLTEIDEAAADFFLNWVYAKVNSGGFEDMIWTDSGTQVCYFLGCNDNGRQTGIARMNWMDNPTLGSNSLPIGAIPRIFYDQGWN